MIIHSAHNLRTCLKYMSFDCSKAVIPEIQLTIKILFYLFIDFKTLSKYTVGLILSRMVTF
jgi:hypothetical protein